MSYLVHLQRRIDPVVSNNGTSREELISQRRAIADAAIDLIEALKQAAPHSRDYPTSVPYAFEGYAADRTTHQERIEAVRAIYESVCAEALALQQQEA